MPNKVVAILKELRHHAPFTLFGAVTGIICMLVFKNAGTEVSHKLFMVFHPGHVILSAIVTASLFRIYEKKAGLLKVLVIGYIGSVGIATLSDSVLPFFGESILGVAVPVHAEMHEHEETGSVDSGVALDEHDHSEETAGDRPKLHLGFIEDWYVVNPAALLGLFIAWYFPRTRFPHAGHVLLSTWASSFHVLMNTHTELTTVLLLGAFVVLFIAVWLPCCISDIVFPLLFVKSAPLCLHHDHETETCS